MRFVDEAEIELVAGHGGAGSVHFRRETMEPRGGPDGGDGGRGANIYIVADSNLATLMDFRFRKKYEAPNGDDGSGKKRAGRDGIDVTLRVPVGTIVRDAATNELLFELIDPNHEPVKMVAGGR